MLVSSFFFFFNFKHGIPTWIYLYDSESFAVCFAVAVLFLNCTFISAGCIYSHLSEAHLFMLPFCFNKYLSIYLTPLLASSPVFLPLGLFHCPVYLAVPPSKNWQVYSCANERVACVCVHVHLDVPVRTWQLCFPCFQQYMRLKSAVIFTSCCPCLYELYFIGLFLRNII